jgi:small subunit ribosomal protein S7
MPRYGRVPKRKIKADAVYNSVLLTKFVNKLMYDGKKTKAENLLYRALEDVADKLKGNPLEIFEKALLNVAPLMEVKSRRVGGATYQVPIEVTRDRGQALAIQWLRDGARGRPGKGMAQKLSLEIMDAFKGVGSAIKKKEDVHKTAEANRAFAHFRW